MASDVDANVGRGFASVVVAVAVAVVETEAETGTGTDTEADADADAIVVVDAVDGIDAEVGDVFGLAPKLTAINKTIKQ